MGLKMAGEVGAGLMDCVGVRPLPVLNAGSDWVCAIGLGVNGAPEKEGEGESDGGTTRFASRSNGSSLITSVTIIPRSANCSAEWLSILWRGMQILTPELSCFSSAAEEAVGVLVGEDRPEEEGLELSVVSSYRVLLRR